VGDTQVETQVGRLRKSAHEDISLPIPTQHRGMVQVGPARVKTRWDSLRENLSMAPHRRCSFTLTPSVY
jgi:hypothetical protein